MSKLPASHFTGIIHGHHDGQRKRYEAAMRSVVRRFNKDNKRLKKDYAAKVAALAARFNTTSNRLAKANGMDRPTIVARDGPENHGVRSVYLTPIQLNFP